MSSLPVTVKPSWPFEQAFLCKAHVWHGMYPSRYKLHLQSSVNKTKAQETRVRTISLFTQIHLYLCNCRNLIFIKTPCDLCTAMPWLYPAISRDAIVVPTCMYLMTQIGSPDSAQIHVSPDIVYLSGSSYDSKCPAADKRIGIKTDFITSFCSWFTSHFDSLTPKLEWVTRADKKVQSQRQPKQIYKSMKDPRLQLEG